MDHSTKHNLISGPLIPCHPLTGAINLRTTSHLRRWCAQVTHVKRTVQARSTTNKDTLPSHLPFVASAPTTNIRRPASTPSHPATSDLRPVTIRLLGWFITPSRLTKSHEVLVPRCACRCCLWRIS